VLPDVIVTDVGMPGLDGADLLASLRCSGLYADIPVVVISGDGNESEEQRLRQLGACDYIRKPFSPVMLQDRLKQIVG